MSRMENEKKEKGKNGRKKRGVKDIRGGRWRADAWMKDVVFLILRFHPFLREPKWPSDLRKHHWAFSFVAHSFAKLLLRERSLPAGWNWFLSRLQFITLLNEQFGSKDLPKIFLFHVTSLTSKVVREGGKRIYRQEMMSANDYRRSVGCFEKRPVGSYPWNLLSFHATMTVLMTIRLRVCNGNGSLLSPCPVPKNKGNTRICTITLH